jgi:uncharacterized protein YjiS (DUF1127 family)
MLAIIKNLFDSYKRHRDFIKTRNELSGLSNRELDDIGISRSMITRIALEKSGSSAS